MACGVSAREAQLRANLSAVERRVSDACEASGRDPGDVTVVVVTKTWPPEDVRLLAGLGVRDFGENRDQEAREKARECDDLRPLGVRWHFVGQVQTNKARSVASYADVVHSVDRPALVEALSSGAEHCGRVVECLVQVSLRDEPGVLSARAGAPPDAVAGLAEAVAGAPGLRLGGVMAVAPRSLDPAEAFTLLAEVAAQVRSAHPDACVVSAGMSADLEAAVTAGATHVRVGTAVLGLRPPLG